MSMVLDSPVVSLCADPHDEPHHQISLDAFREPHNEDSSSQAPPIAMATSSSAVRTVPGAIHSSDESGEENDDDAASVDNGKSAGANGERRIRIKHSPILECLCLTHGTSVKDSNSLVCEGRKSIHILSFGKIDSIACFRVESPSSSFRVSKDSKGMARSQWKSLVIPNGWKVAAYIHGELWIAEVRYASRAPQFQFCKLDERGTVIECSEWQKTPSAAFNASVISRKNDKPLRHNGKLFLGVHYEAPQSRLREFFSKTKQTYTDEVKAFVDAWLNNQALPYGLIPQEKAIERNRKRTASETSIPSTTNKTVKIDQSEFVPSTIKPGYSEINQPSISPSRPFAFQPLLNSTLSLLLSQQAFGGFSLPPPVLPTLPISSYASSSSKTAIELYASIAQHFPEVRLDTVQQLYQFAPFAAWDIISEQRLSREDFVDFVDQVERICAEVHQWSQSNGIIVVTDISQVLGYFQLAILKPTVAQRAMTFLSYQLRKRLLLEGPLKFPELSVNEFTKSIIGLPSAAELTKAIL